MENVTRLKGRIGDARCNTSRCFTLLALNFLFIVAPALAQSPLMEGGGSPAELWANHYDGPTGEDDIAHALAVSSDGATVFVTGQSRGENTNNDMATVAYDVATEEQIWAARYNGPGSHIDVAYALSVSPDSAQIIVTGRSWGSGTGYDYATIAYDAETGDEQWVARYNGLSGANDVSWGLVVSPDGATVFVTGQSPGPNGNDFTTVAYDTANGDEQWVARYAGPDDNDIAEHIGISPDGSTVFVNGYSRTDGNTEYDFATVAYDAETGDELWTARYDGPAPSTSSIDNPTALRVDPNGQRVYITGQSPGAGTEMDYATIAYDTETGEELWATRHDAADLTDNVWALGVSPDGETIFVTGTSWGVGTNAVYATVAYDAETGDEVWTTYFERPGVTTDEARSLGVSPDGLTIFVTGRSFSVDRDNNDIVTVAFDVETGDELWATEYDGPAGDGDVANALTIGPNGYRVYVAGESESSGTDTDYVTIAYELAKPAFGSESLDFGDVEVDSTSAPQTVTLTNTSNADATGLSFSSLTETDFEANTSACGDTLPAGESCEVDVTFTPIAPGPVSAILEVRADDGGPPALLNLEGNGVGGVGTEDDPLAFHLSNATPNPADGATSLVLHVPEIQEVTARVYDALGRIITTVYDGVLAAGEEVHLEIDTADLAAGTYVVRVEGETFAQTRRFAVTR